MMLLCGLKVVLSPVHPVPSILRFGPNNVMVVSAQEYAGLAKDVWPGTASYDAGRVSALLQEHEDYLRKAVSVG